MSEPRRAGEGERTAWARLAARLRERLEAGGYAAQAFLPAERELAEEFGVNRKTVRRAIEALTEAGWVQPEGRRGNRILARREPRTAGGAGLVALVIYDMSRGGSSIIFRGCHQVTQRSGHHLIVAETWTGASQTQNTEAEQLRRLIERRVEGIVLYAEPTGENRALVEEALRQGIAVVLIDRLLPGLDCDFVGVDNAPAAREAVHHLVAQGHRRIAFLGIEPAASTVVERYAGYRQALEEAGIDPDPELAAAVPPGLVHPSIHRQLVQRWLRLPDPPTALFSVNDEHACLAMQGLRAEGRSVPGDVSVVGFSNQPLATMVEPPLTTVAQPFLHIGEFAAQLLLERITGRYRGVPRRVLLPTQFIVRESTTACTVVSRP